MPTRPIITPEMALGQGISKDGSIIRRQPGDTLFVGVGPLVDVGKRWLLHGKVTTGAIPRAFGNV
jgi:hypothetical protein